MTNENRNYNIAVLGGDGTGPEVTVEALKVLNAIASQNGFSLNLTEFDYGGDRYLKTGTVLTDEEMEGLKKFDAILLGAVGHPDVKPGILEKGLLLKTRFGLEQYINLRPVKLYPGVYTPLKDKGPDEIDFVVVRENNEGLYVGEGEFQNKGTADEVALQVSRNTRKGVERCIRYAFEYTRKRNKDKKLTLCAKTNVLTYAHDLWWRVFNEVGEEYPDITKDYAHVDATCMWMVKNPEWFDVIVTDNMFGDIITDLGAMIQGGMGIAAGGNINPEGVSMFEPIGGSAPKYTGKNVINPLAAICAGAMMLDQLGETESAQTVEKAVMKITTKLDSLAAGKMGFSTTEVGDMVTDEVCQKKKYNVAIMGATGAVGQEMLKILAQRKFPINKLVLLASKRSAGKRIRFRGKSYTVKELNNQSFEGIDIVLASAGGSLSKKYAEPAKRAGAVIVDNTSAFRMDPKVPLVIPEINPKAIKKHKGIIANPNCSTIVMLVPLHPLDKAAKMKRITVATYQAASGAGAKAMEELKNQTHQVLQGKKAKKEAFPHQIAFNLFSHNSKIGKEGYNEEEMKMIRETWKILGRKNIDVDVTCVRVPVFRAHSEAIYVDFKKPLSVKKAKQILKKSKGVQLKDDVPGNTFPMPLDAADRDDVYVGRIRQSISSKKSLGLFVSGDQLRKGAALNAVQIAEHLIGKS